MRALAMSAWLAYKRGMIISTMFTPGFTIITLSWSWVIGHSIAWCSHVVRSGDGHGWGWSCRHSWRWLIIEWCWWRHVSLVPIWHIIPLLWRRHIPLRRGSTHHSLRKLLLWWAISYAAWSIKLAILLSL